MKNAPANAGDSGLILGQEDPLEKEMATHSSILAWKIPWTGSLADYNPWGRKELGVTEYIRTEEERWEALKEEEEVKRE